MSDFKPKSVLGRGLDALIPRAPRHDHPVEPSFLTADDGSMEGVTAIDLSKVRANPFQPRVDFDADALEDLKNSIKAKGIIQPVTVRRIAGGRYELIAGERRVRASQELGNTSIPAYILKVDTDEEMLELALIENLQRENLNPMEIASSYQRLIDECRLTQDEVAQKVGKNRSTVTNFLRLLKLPEFITNSVRRGEISEGHARMLVSLPDEKTQKNIHAKIVQQGLSVRAVEHLVKNLGVKSEKKKKKIAGGRSESSFQSVETRLRQQFGTKVSIHKRAGGAGEIVIEYYNPDDLDRLIEMLQQ